MCLAIYGIKCGKSFEDVQADALSLMPFLNSIKPDEPFTEQDIRSALECYDLKYCTFPIDDIVKISGIPIEKNKRNGRKQSEHIKLMNFVRDEINQNKTWRDGNGRPKGSSEQRKIVEKWQSSHPGGKKADCIRETGLSKPTVYRWWSVNLKPEMMDVKDGEYEVIAEFDGKLLKHLLKESGIKERKP
jgi:hypothetical protein